MAENYLTLSMKNLFSFTCPIFSAEVQMRGCVLVRDKVYQGQHFEERRGCQACISGGKCPAAAIIQQIAFRRSDATDRCSSLEAKTGRLPLDALEKIRPVLMTHAVMGRYNLSPAELNLIETANARIDAQIATAPRERVAGRLNVAEAPVTAKPKKRAPVAAPTASANISAAISGDMSAAINAAA